MTHRMDIDYICDSKKAVAKSLCSNVDQLSNEDAMVAADVIKDLSEAEKNCWEAKYYESIVNAMEESDKYGMRMGYNPNRNAKGQYSDGRSGYYPPIYDMMPVYGYRNDGGMMNNRHDDKYGREFGEYREAKRNYTETHSKADKDRMDDHANAHIMNSISTIKEIWESADPELRRRIKNDMSNLLSNMNV